MWESEFKCSMIEQKDFCSNSFNVCKKFSLSMFVQKDKQSSRDHERNGAYEANLVTDLVDSHSIEKMCKTRYYIDRYLVKCNATFKATSKI